MLARRLFDGDITVEELGPLPNGLTLHPDEERMVAAAVPKRRREFAAGRHCARRALERLDIHGFALVAGADRAPRWPAGVVGSISHTDRYCVAVVARRAAFASLGVDAEPAEPLECELWETVCTDAERRWLDTQPELERGRMARLIFSAKECAYKCQYPLTGVLLDFHDLQIEVDREAGRFTATYLRRVESRFELGRMHGGRFVMHSDLIGTGMTLRAR